MANKMKAISAVAAASVLTLSLAACGSNNDNNNNASPAATGTSEAGSGAVNNGEKVKITLQNIYVDETTPSAKGLKQTIEEYQKAHPNVTIELDTLNTDNQKQKLKTQAASKTIPDITMVNPAAQMAPFVEAGLFAPLNDMVEKDGLKDTYQSGLLDYYTFDGNLYALPDGNNIEVVYYNKDLFAQAGIDAPPATFEELLEDVKALKAKGITPFAIGEKDTWTGSFMFMNILLRTNNGPGFLNDVLEGKKTFEDPAFVEAVDAFQQLIQAGAFPEGATSLDANAGANLYKSGKAAMFMIGSWETGSVDGSTAGPNTAAFTFPTVNGKGDPNQYMLAPGTAFAISANSKHIDVAKDFLHYYTSNLPTKQFELKNAVGQPQIITGNLAATGYSELAISVLDLFSKVNGGDLSFDNTMKPAVSQVHLNSLQNMFVQKVDPAAVAKEHQAAYEANK